MPTLSDLPPFWYLGRLTCVSGYGEAARHQLHVLAKHGLDVYGWGCPTAVPVKDRTTPFFERIRELTRAPNPSAPLGGSIFHLTPDNADAYRQYVPRPHIGVTAWETSCLPHGWVNTINGYDQLWTPTQWQADVYRHSGITAPIEVVPFAFDPQWYPLDGPAHPAVDRIHQTPNLRGDLVRRTVFTSVFAWDARKNPEGLIRAYVGAFTGSDDVVLVIKSYTKTPEDASIQNRVTEILLKIKHPHPPMIVVINEDLSRADMLALLRSTDVYVCTSRGEGWGLPLSEAAHMGVPSIYANNSAMAETRPGTCSVPCKELPVYGMVSDWYTWPQTWWEPSIADLICDMRDLHQRGVSALAVEGQTDRAAIQAAYPTSRAAEAAHAALKRVLESAAGT